ncbi:hypothetical protein T05_2158 [Trichinella murrelli]|uniref:Uncharacterized protein n=1 Tax=Trichinella murrelli TaxID=144512 RepID=A0A0V0T9S7_9BILA|nr:hypothetical protein T05_2158 [Trichinella murrelli]
MTPVKDQIPVEDHRSSGDSKTPDHAVLLAKSTTRKNIVLQTANAFIENEDGERQMVMCLCQQSLVRKKIADLIGLKGHREHVKITRLGDSCGQHKWLQRVKFRLKDVRNDRKGLSMEAFVRSDRLQTVRKSEFERLEISAKLRPCGSISQTCC